MESDNSSSSTLLLERTFVWSILHISNEPVLNNLNTKGSVSCSYHKQRFALTIVRFSCGPGFGQPHDSSIQQSGLNEAFVLL